MVPLFEYRRSTRTEGVIVLLTLAGTLLGFGAFAFFGIFPDDILFRVCLLLVIGCVGLLVVIYAMKNLLVRDEFIVRIDETAVEQIVPVRGAGDSFRVPVRAVDHMERMNDDGTVRLVIVDHDGERFELTINYGNPLGKIEDVMESLNVQVRRF
jgi:hypothetical protein